MVKGGRVRFSGFRPWHHVTQTPSPFQAPVGRNLFLNDTLHGEILAVCTVNVVRGREGEREREKEREKTISKIMVSFSFLNLQRLLIQAAADR